MRHRSYVERFASKLLPEVVAVGLMGMRRDGVVEDDNDARTISPALDLPEEDE